MMQNSNRLDFIDTLRGIAVLLVIWLHVSEVYVNISPYVKENFFGLYDLAWSLNVGQIGVVIFFAISGFVLPNSLKGSKKQATKTFVLRRFYRLYPAFWVSIPFGIFTMGVLMQHSISTADILANITMIPSLFQQTIIMGQYWTLEVELVFYVSCWILFMLNLLHNPKTQFFGILFFISVYVFFKLIKLSDEYVDLLIYPIYFSILFWGSLFRIYFEFPNMKIHFFRTIHLKYVFFFSTFIVLFFPILHLLKGIVIDKFAMRHLGFGVSLGLIIFYVWVQHFQKSNVILKRIGTISYSMYLFHPVIFYSLYWYLTHHQNNLLTTLPLSLYILVNILLTIGFAAIIYKLVEKPFINYAHTKTRYTKK